jgi:PAS domain S-box-containing protein
MTPRRKAKKISEKASPGDRSKEDVDPSPGADRVQDAEARLHAVLSTEIDAIIVIDERGTIESADPALTRIFGYSAHEVLGKNVDFLMPEPYRLEHDGYLANYLRTVRRKSSALGARLKVSRKMTLFFSLSSR